MPQRITDILPPKEVKLEKKTIEKISLPEKKKREAKIKKFRFRIFLISIFLVMIVLLGLGFGGYYFSFGAKIIIWPKQDLITSQTEVTCDKGAKDINIFARIIPAYLFQEEKTISQDFPATGKSQKETRAEGIIRVYNNYSTSPQILVANTRFISSEGKLFRSLEKVVVPGGVYEGGKFQPGYIDVKVRAAEPGEEYNIGPSTFSIPGFAGTPKYTGFYGKSFEPMKGGSKGEFAQVTESDIQNAKNTLTQNLFEETRNNLKTKISSEYVLIEEAIRDKILEISAPEAGAFEDSFKIEIKGISEALVFKKSDLENFAKENILFKKPADKKLNQESLKIDYSLGKIDIDSGKIYLNLNTSAKIFSEINENELKGNITGKTPLQIRDFLNLKPQIEKIEIKLLPFWTKKAPTDINKIKIELKF